MARHGSFARGPARHLDVACGRLRHTLLILLGGRVHYFARRDERSVGAPCSFQVRRRANLDEFAHRKHGQLVGVFNG